MVTIRRFEQKDWAATWRVIEPVFRAGETYAFPQDITESEAYQLWVAKPSATYLALDEDDNVLGTYYLKPNQPGAGAHICNCGYIVSEAARGQGIASKMCAHSQKEAQLEGFLAMQYNLVVSTNQVAVRVWQKAGFSIIGTIPKAFNHPQEGLVDAYIMYKEL